KTCELGVFLIELLHRQHNGEPLPFGLERQRVQGFGETQISFVGGLELNLLPLKGGDTVFLRLDLGQTAVGSGACLTSREGGFGRRVGVLHGGVNTASRLPSSQSCANRASRNVTSNDFWATADDPAD